MSSCSSLSSLSFLHSAHSNSNVINRWIYAWCKFNYIKIFSLCRFSPGNFCIFVCYIHRHYNRFNAMLLGMYFVKQCCPSNNCLHFTIRYTSNFHATVHIMYIHCNAWLIVMPVPMPVTLPVPVPVQSLISHTRCDCMSCWIFPTNFPLARYIVSEIFFLSFYVHFVLRIIVVVVAIRFFYINFPFIISTYSVILCVCSGLYSFL